MISSSLQGEGQGKGDSAMSAPFGWLKYHFCLVFEMVIRSTSVKVSSGSRR